MANGISKETFEGMDVDSKLGVLFDYARENFQAIEDLKSQKTYHKVCAWVGGVVGGMAAFLGSKFLGN